MADRMRDRSEFGMVTVPAMMAPEGRMASALPNPFGRDAVAVPAMLVPEGYEGTLPGYPYFLAGHAGDGEDRQDTPSAGSAGAPTAPGAESALAPPSDRLQDQEDRPQMGRSLRASSHPPLPAAARGPVNDRDKTQRLPSRPVTARLAPASHAGMVGRAGSDQDRSAGADGRVRPRHDAEAWQRGRGGFIQGGSTGGQSRIAIKALRALAARTSEEHQPASRARETGTNEDA